MSTRSRFMSVFAAALMVLAFVPQRANADDDDPPTRVARLSYLSGSVSFEPAGTDDWVSAEANRPMTTGDKLWSDNDSRAELHIGSASIRLSNSTGFSFLNLTDSVAQLQLTAGTLRIRVKRLDENETFEVDTPNLAFSILRPGVYRISVNDAGDATSITVRQGQGEVTGAGSAYNLRANQAGVFTGTDQLNGDLEDYDNGDDEFDQWCAGRDRHDDLSVSARYVSPDVIGYEDLDDNGGWRPVPEYGTVWFPHTTIVGWAPYHYGHWAYVAPWGYTWIDDAPWGFAPFHYGRWVFVDGAWGWVPAPPPAPGVVYVRPVYAPALVAWIGGPHFAVGVGVGGGFAAGVNVGWFALGPREVYVPSYPVSRTYVTNVNISNTTVNQTVVNNYYNTTVVNKVTVVNQTYINQRVTGAVMVTTPQAFTSAQPVARNVVRVDVREMAAAPVNVMTPTGAPSKQAVLGGGTAARVRPPAFVQSRAVVAKVTPPPPPASFAKQQQAIQANGGKPLALSKVRQLQPQSATAVHPNVKIAPPSKPANLQNRQGNNQGNVGGRNPQGNTGQPAAGGNAGNQGTQEYRKSNDRPPSAQQGSGQQNPGGNPVQPQNNKAAQTNTGNQQGTGSNAGGQGTQEYRKFNDRPPSAQQNPGGNAAQPQNNNKAAQTNANQPAAGGNTGSQGNRGTPANNPPANAAGTNSGLDARHQQQIEQLHQQQDQERQKLEQQQQQEREKLAQQKADEQAQQQLNQKHQQQLEQQQAQHNAQAQQLQQKQEQERKDESAKSSKDKDKDAPHK